ncbi:hypothetical protein V8C86DRAFT_2443644 [Haematococcus lacustris]
MAFSCGACIAKAPQEKAIVVYSDSDSDRRFTLPTRQQRARSPQQPSPSPSATVHTMRSQAPIPTAVDMTNHTTLATGSQELATALRASIGVASIAMLISQLPNELQGVIVRCVNDGESRKHVFQSSKQLAWAMLQNAATVQLTHPMSDTFLVNEREYPPVAPFLIQALQDRTAPLRLELKADPDCWCHYEGAYYRVSQQPAWRTSLWAAWEGAKHLDTSQLTITDCIVSGYVMADGDHDDVEDDSINFSSSVFSDNRLQHLTCLDLAGVTGDDITSLLQEIRALPRLHTLIFRGATSTGPAKVTELTYHLLNRGYFPFEDIDPRVPITRDMLDVKCKQAKEFVQQWKIEGKAGTPMQAHSSKVCDAGMRTCVGLQFHSRSCVRHACATITLATQEAVDVWIGLVGSNGPRLPDVATLVCWYQAPLEEMLKLNGASSGIMLKNIRTSAMHGDMMQSSTSPSNTVLSPQPMPQLHGRASPRAFAPLP